MEYLFKKDDLQDLINKATNCNYIAIGINFLPGPTDAEFKAVIAASAVYIESGTRTEIAEPPVNGCPNPPGC